MKLSFHGAAREVTGSCHLLELEGKSLLLDCGMIQGGKERHDRNRKPFGFDPRKLDCVILSHAHIDHSGRLPLLRKAGYRGPILATEATCKLAEILLLDSGHIHEEDARWKIKRLKKQGKDWKWVQPLFTKEDAEAVLEQFVPVPFGEPRVVDGFGRLTLLKAGHILGAAIVKLELRIGDRSRTLVFSGDLGVEGARLLSGPRKVECPDYLLIESTYGNRQREDRGDRTEELYAVIRRTVDRGGKLIIPSFAVGRTQEVLARINDLVESGRLSGIPVYVDSPMAVTATKLFEQYPEAYSERARRLLRAGDRPLEFPGLKLVSDIEDSKAINDQRDPCIIISASGMCTAGRIRHHLAHNISDPRNTVLFVGYQAEGSLGRVILTGTTPVRIFGEWHTRRAEIARIESFSAHADLDELLEWFDCMDRTPKCTYVVHGEERVALFFAETLRREYGANVEVPFLGQSFEVEG